jgi:hypothetical protein
MSDDPQLRDALQRTFPPVGSPAVWSVIEERGRRARRRRRLLRATVGLVLAGILLGGSLQGYRALSDDPVLRITDENLIPAPDSSSPRLLPEYEGRLVDPATLSEPALARIVSALLARDIPVIEAAVVSASPPNSVVDPSADEPLRLALTIAQNGGGEPILAHERARREAAAEWVREARLRELQVTVVDPSGKVVVGMGIPFPEGVQIDLSAVPKPTLDLDAAKEELAVLLGQLDIGPATIAELDLSDDVLDARQLHVELVVPEFEKNIEAYEEALAAIGQATSASSSGGTGVAVLWVDAVNEQGQLLVASWSDAQLHSIAGQKGLAKDYFPSNLPRPAIIGYDIDGLAARVKALFETANEVPPILLPSQLPLGFGVSPEGVADHWGAGGEPKPNPWNWSSLGGGYGVLFSDRTHAIRLDVNPAADFGEVIWEPLDTMAQNGQPLRIMKLPDGLQTDEVVIAVPTRVSDGSSAEVRSVFVQGPKAAQEAIIDLAASVQDWSQE